MALHTNRLLSLLDERQVEYELLHHALDYTAQRTAADTHTPGREFAKTVVLSIGERFVVVVMPAHHKVDFTKARRFFGGQVTLATEDQIAKLFPDCEVGAEPPLGNLYGLPVYVSPALIDDEKITFNAGTHHDAVRMRYADFEALADPKIADLTWHH